MHKYQHTSHFINRIFMPNARATSRANYIISTRKFALNGHLGILAFETNDRTSAYTKIQIPINQYIVNSPILYDQMFNFNVNYKKCTYSVHFWLVFFCPLFCDARSVVSFNFGRSQAFLSALYQEITHILQLPEGFSYSSDYRALKSVTVRVFSPLQPRQLLSFLPSAMF